MEKPKRVSTRLKREPLSSSAAVTSTVPSNGCQPKPVTRINGLQKKIPGLSKSGHNSSKQHQTGESTVIKNGGYMKDTKKDEPNRSKTMSRGSELSPKTRLATKQANVTEQRSNIQRERRRENREQRKQQISRTTTKKVETVGCKGSKVQCKEESRQVKGMSDVEVEDMEIQDIQKAKQQDGQMLRTLSEDLTLSDTDDDLDPMVTDSQCSLNDTNQSVRMSSQQWQGDQHHGVDHQQDISIPDSHSVSQRLELSRSDTINSHIICEQNQLREKTVTQRPHCARCRRYNCAVTNERRRQHLVALWLLPEHEIKVGLVPEIVEWNDRNDRRKCAAWLTKSYCNKMLKNGYRTKVIKKEPETEQEPKTEQEPLPVKLGVKIELPMDSHIPHHLLLAEEQQPEKGRSSSPDVRNEITSNGGDIIEEAMQAALNGECLSEHDKTVEQETASSMDNLFAGISNAPVTSEQPVIDASKCDNSIPEVTKDGHKVDVSIDNTTTPRTSLGDMPISAHQPTPEVTSTDNSVDKDIEADTVTQPCWSGSHDSKTHNVTLHCTGSCDDGSHDVTLRCARSCDDGSHDVTLHCDRSHDAVLSTHTKSCINKLQTAGSWDTESLDRNRFFKSPQCCPVTKTVMTPVVSPPCGKQKRTKTSQQTTKKPCVVDLRSIKTVPPKENKFIRTGKINLSTLKAQSSTETDISLKRIIQQKNVSLNVTKLPTDQLPARQLWPSPKSAPSIAVSSIEASRPESDDFTFNLDKVVSRAAKQFSFTSPPAKPTGDDDPNRSTPSVFQRLGDQQSPFKKPATLPVEPKTPPYGPQNEEDLIELYTVDDIFDDMTDIHPPARVAPKILPPPRQNPTAAATLTNNVSSMAVPATTRQSVQKCVQFSDRSLPQQEKHQQVTQWVNNTRIDPPPPPPGYHTSSDGSGPALFSFPSSPVPTPATSPPNLDDDFDTPSVQLNIPKEANSAMQDARKLISDGVLWNRRESLNSNGLTWSGAPKGMCFKYWGTGNCPHHQMCKFHHVRNPAVDKWWNSEGFLGEMELLISHSVEIAWLHLKSRPSSLLPPSLLDAVIVACTNRAIVPVNHANFIQIAEEAFSRVMSLQRCPRDCFFTMLKCYTAHHCNTQAFWLVQEMNKYGYLLSKDMAICLLGCYQPPVTHLLDLVSWIESAGLFQSMYNRIAQCVTMETPLQELCAFLETCTRHRVKLHYGNTTNLINICAAQNNCEAIIRVLEVSHDPSIISVQHLEQVLMTHTPDQLDRITNIMVTLFPHDVCQKVSGTAWNKLLSQSCSQQRSAKAMQIFNYMSRILIRIDKEVYLSLMMLHCNQRHPSEVLTVLEHQIRCHGDTSNISVICQELLKHHYWGVLCDLVVCMINTGNKPEELMIHDIKNALLQNDEVQRWKSLVEKARSIGVELDCPAVVPTPLELPDSAVLLSHPDGAGMPQQEQSRWHHPQQAVVQEKNVTFSLDSVDNSIAPSTVASAPPPVVAPPPVAAAPSPVVSQAPSQQQITVAPTSLPPSQDSSVDFSFLLPDMMQEYNAAPPPAAVQPSLSSAKSLLSLEDDGGTVLAIVKKSIVDGQWMSLGAILQMMPISLQLIQVVATTIQSQSNISNAMTSMITSFKKFHQIENNGQFLSGDLTLHERDLIGRVGVTMIMNAVAMEKWQDGFHVLYALHHHGIHYVTDQGGWSPCIIAMAAVECCLRLDIPQSALEVMRGAQWVNGTTPVEKDKRNKILEKLVKACIAKKEISGAEETLRAMESMVNHGELYQLVLTAAKQNGNTDIYKRLCKKNQPVSVANTTVTSFSMEASNNSPTKINLFSADRAICFGPQAVSSPSITAVLPSSVSSTTPSITSPVVKSTQLPAELKREMRTGFRQKVTKACSHHLKDFHKANRISKDDYIRLVRVLSKKFYNQVEAASSGPWELTDLLTQEIQRTVENLFSQCTVYTKDLDSKLNLVES